MTECERLIAEGFITEEFLEPEVRCDYEISAKMKKMWAIELDLYRAVSEMCEKHHLRYWIAYGSLIGAVRHKGFIPWDDDIDIMMPRSDYQKLLRLQKEFRPPYFFQTTQSDVDYYAAFARLRNSNTTGFQIDSKSRSNKGIYIDILPLDGFPEKGLRRKLLLFTNQTRTVLGRAYFYNVNPSILTRTANKIMHLPFVHYDPVKSYRRANTLSAKYKWKDFDEVGLTCFPFGYGEECVVDKDCFNGTEWMDFEFLKVPVPAGYDKFLRQSYGDYMKFPPVEERGLWHHYTFEPDIPFEEYETWRHEDPK